jgi:hypothetical protein
MANLAETLRLAVDRREYPRVPVTIPGQMSITAEQGLRAVQVTNLSAGGAGLRYAGAPPRAEMIGILEVEGFGRYEGITTRETGDVCGLRFLFGEAERHHLLERLSVFVRNGLSSVGSLRDEECWSAHSQLSLTRHCGEQHECKVMDISLLGVALGTSISVPEGENVFVGKMFGRVVRGPSDQVTIQFLRYRGEQPAARLRA